MQGATWGDARALEEEPTSFVLYRSHREARRRIRNGSDAEQCQGCSRDDPPTLVVTGSIGWTVCASLDAWFEPSVVAVCAQRKRRERPGAGWGRRGQVRSRRASYRTAVGGGSVVASSRSHSRVPSLDLDRLTSASSQENLDPSAPYQVPTPPPPLLGRRVPGYTPPGES